MTLGPGVERDGALWLAAATSEDDPAAPRPGAEVSATGRSRRFPAAGRGRGVRLRGLLRRGRQPDALVLPSRPLGPTPPSSLRPALVGGLGAVPGGQRVLRRGRRPEFRRRIAPRCSPRTTSWPWWPECWPSADQTCGSATFPHTPVVFPPGAATVRPDEAVASELLSGLSGGGPVGFHTARWATAFEACSREMLGVDARTFVAPAATGRRRSARPWPASDGVRGRGVDRPWS